MRSRRLATLLTMVAAGAGLLLAQTSPVAADTTTQLGASCSGSFDFAVAGEASCTFLAAYDPADATRGLWTASAGADAAWTWTMVGPVGVNTNSAVVRLFDQNGNVLLDCVMTGGVCGTQSAYSAPPVPAGTPLYCVIDGVGSGEYGCRTL